MLYWTIFSDCACFVREREEIYNPLSFINWAQFRLEKWISKTYSLSTFVVWCDSRYWRLFPKQKKNKFFPLFYPGGAIALGILYLTYSLYKSINKEAIPSRVVESRPLSKSTILTTDMWKSGKLFSPWIFSKMKQKRSDANIFYILHF